MECEFMCDDGIARLLDITAEATAPFACVYQSRLLTPRGEAVVLGTYAGRLYVLLDSNTTALVATAFTREDFEAGRLQPLPDLPAKINITEASHRVKRNIFRGRRVGIVTQDHNGPCPVLAAANALSLLGKLDLCKDESRRIEAQQLRGMILEYIKKSTTDMTHFLCPPTRIMDGAEVLTIRGLVEQRLNEARIKLSEGNNGEEYLNRLYHGMNISPIFSSIDGFDAEEDVLLFALAGLRVLHGWIIPKESQYTPLRDMSFNEVSLLATNKDTELSIIANEFLETTKSQLTEEGLNIIRDKLSEGEVAVLFWNNHFSTAVKLNGRLLLLLSDETYADRSSIFFESIEDVHGASIFTDGEGNNTDTFILAIQSLTGNEFTEEAVADAVIKLKSENSEEPSPEVVVDFLRRSNKKGETGSKNKEEEQKGEWPLWVREAADTIMEMGFNLDYTDACKAVQKCGSVSAAISEFFHESNNS